MPKQVKVSPVRQMLDGLTVAIYENRNVASNATGIDLSSIRQACKGIRKSAGGFKWSPARLNTKGAAKLSLITQLDQDGTVRGHYSDVTLASMATGIKAGNISYALNGKRKSAGGFLWQYPEEK